MEDLSTLIEDSITDATLPTPEVDLDTPSEPLEAAPEPSTELAAEEPSIEVPNPATRAEEAAKPAQDDFDKKYGLTAQSASGRENRIPYSRVKKITEKAVNDAKSAWQKEAATGFVPAQKFTELDTKVKDYESRLTQVAEFEKVMTQDPVRFLQMLNGLPAYSQIFQQLRQPTPPQAEPTPDPRQAQPTPSDEMPQPDQDLPDGSKVYSLDGLKALLAWQDQRTESRTVERVMKQVEARYAPIEKDYNSYQKVQQIMPQVERQIADARTWPLFNENEESIVQTLKDNPTFSLERAYQHVVVPSLKAEQDRLATTAKVTRESLRAEILKELKNAPRATATTAGATRPAPLSSSTGNRSIEEVIADSIKGLK